MSSSLELHESKLVRFGLLITKGGLGDAEKVLRWCCSPAGTAFVQLLISLSRSPGEEMGLSSRDEPQKKKSLTGGRGGWAADVTGSQVSDGGGP